MNQESYMHARTFIFAAILLVLMPVIVGCAAYDDYEYGAAQTPGGPLYKKSAEQKEKERSYRAGKPTILTPVKLPNLVVGRFNWVVEDGRAHFRLKVRNDGDAPAGAFSIVATVKFSDDPDAPPMQFTQRSEEPVPAHAQQDVYMAVIDKAAFISDTVVTVDPPAESAPGGSVWESNETDNTDSERWSCAASGCEIAP